MYEPLKGDGLVKVHHQYHYCHLLPNYKICRDNDKDAFHRDMVVLKYVCIFCVYIYMYVWFVCTWCMSVSIEKHRSGLDCVSKVRFVMKI